MPTYDYLCDACGHRFEQFQSITASTLRKCPACGKAKLRRLIGVGAAVLFKGGGFYETDYRSESYRKAEQAERGAATTPDAKTDSSSQAKGETKGETNAAPTTAASSGTAAGGDAAAPSTSSGAGTAPSPPPAARKPGKSHAREGRGVGNLRTESARAPKAAKASKAAPPPRRGGAAGRRGR